jgi:hypothetical protein
LGTSHAQASKALSHHINRGISTVTLNGACTMAVIRALALMPISINAHTHSIISCHIVCELREKGTSSSNRLTITSLGHRLKEQPVTSHQSSLLPSIGCFISR